MSEAILEGYNSLVKGDGNTDFTIVPPTPYLHSYTKIKRWWNKSYDKVTYTECALISYNDSYIVVSCDVNVLVKIIADNNNRLDFNVIFKNQGDGGIKRILVCPKDELYDLVNYDDYYYDYGDKQIKKLTYSALYHAAGSKPTLDQRFAIDKSLIDKISGNNLITFSRASSGTYVGSDGLIKTAVTDASRFDHDPVTGESLGLLIEESRTNYISNESVTFSAGDGATIITPNAFTAPDGSNTAIRVQATNSYVNMSGGKNSVPAGSTLTASYYIYSAVEIPNCRSRVTYGSGNLDTIKTIPAGKWTRFVCDAKVDDTGSDTTFSWRPLTTINDFGVSSTDCYIWGFQVEVGSFPTSYIPTTGSTVTRAADIASIEGNKFAKTNLLSYSERFDQWTAGANTTVTPNYETAPDGSFTADRLQFTNSSGTFLSNTAATAGTQYTFSVYIKASASSVSAGTNQIFLKVGGVSQTVTATTEWQRVSKTLTASNTNPATFDNVGVSDVSIFGAQLEEGSELTEYTSSVETFVSRASTATYVDDATELITTTPSGAARYENGELLLEPARTNFIDRNTSNYSSIWANAVPSGAYNNAGIAPDGTNTAFATTAYAPAVRGQKNYIITADTNDYTFSIFIKSTGGQGQYVTYNTGVHVNDQDSANQVAYDFSTDTVGHGYSRKIYANGWVRIWKTYTNNNKTLFLTTNSGTTSLDMLFWGTQVEIGSYPSSLIITPAGANVTRAADVSTSALGVDSWYNQSEGTVFVAVDKAYKANTIAASLDDGSGANRIEVRSSGNSLSNVRFDINDNSTGIYSKQPSNTGANNLKLALAYKTGSVNNATNGVVGTVVAATSIPNVSRLVFQNEIFSVDQRPGHISRLAYFTTRKTDQELVNMTS